MLDQLHAAVTEIDDLYWFGYTVAWVGVLTDVAGGYKPVWISLYAFGTLVCLIMILHSYYCDYLRVSPESTTEDTK